MAELFANYDLEQKPYWIKLSRYILLTFILHTLFVISIAYVPMLRSMLHIAFLFGDADYVNEDYLKAEIRDSSITWLENGRFEYPAGYFSKDAPWNVPTDKIVEKREVAEIKRPKPTPKPTPKSKPTPESSEVAKSEPTPSPTPQSEVAQNSNRESEDPNLSEQEAEEALNKQATEANIKRPPKINTKPFKDLIAEANKMWEAGELDLSGSMEMLIEGDLGENGSLVNIRINKKRGDPKLEEIAKKFIQALSASRGLAFLDGVKHLSISLKLDDRQINAVATTQVDTSDRATQMAEGYSGLLFIERVRKSGRDEAIILKNTNISSEGNNIVVKFKMPRTTAKDLISKHIPKA
jgi:hypothetical protein